MGRKKHYTPLNIFMGNFHVGKLEREPNGKMRFCYDVDWQSWKKAVPLSLSLPLQQSVHTGPQVINYQNAP